MKKIKEFHPIILGIVALMVTFLAIQILVRILNLYQIRLLTWIPILMVCAGYYIAGVINKNTKITLLPILLIGLIAFIPLKYFYVPFIFTLLICASMALLLPRKDILLFVRIPFLIFILGIFSYHLFSNPLIIKRKGFSSDNEGNLYNVTVLWDFREAKPTRVPEVTFSDIDGNIVTLDDFKGKNIYVNFWATWCAPCMAEKPKLEEIKTKLKNEKNIIFIDISLDTNLNAWKNFVKEHQPSGIQINTPSEKQTRRAFQIIGIPHSIVVSSEGYYKSFSRPSKVNENELELLKDSKKLEKYIKTTIKYFESDKQTEN